MGKTLKSDETLREYLLGRVSDETVLEGVEELLFTDEEFCSRVALMEDGIINDYVFGRLDERDAESFRSSLARNPERRFKLELTQALRDEALATQMRTGEDRASIFASVKAFFSQPKYAGALAILLIAAVASTLYFTRTKSPDQLAELRSIYRQSRPIEPRISEFDYAPLPQLRGEPDPADRNKLRRIENSLIDSTEAAPGARTHYDLGVFYLTQQKYEEAIKEFENALRFDDKLAKLHNDLGAARFELAKIGEKEKQFELMALSLEEFTKATELDGDLLEALFNKSLALQELRMPRQARESWTLYLQKDPSSPWAEEARKNLARIESQQSLFKSETQVLEDFLTAYRNRDESLAQRIHNDTKGLLHEPAVPLQLSRRYLLARRRGDYIEAKESLDALTFIGRLDRDQNADLFFADLAGFYAAKSADKTEKLLQAKEGVASGLKLMRSDYSKAILQFDKSRDSFMQLGNVCEAAIAEIWASQCLPPSGKVAEGRRRLEAAIAMADVSGFRVLLPPAYYWLGIGDYFQKEFSRSGTNLRMALRLAEEGHNTFESKHAQEALALNYSMLGELEPALFYASKTLDDAKLYYQSRSQWLRNMGTLAHLSLELSLPSTALNLSTEEMSVARDISSTGRQINDSLRYMVLAAAARKDFAAALKYASDSMQIALEAADSPENTRIKGDIYQLAGDVKSQTKDYSDALIDYDRALDLYRRIPEMSASLYQTRKGRLFCFQQLNDDASFAAELKAVLDLSEEYRRAIREDQSRQAFFADERSVFDAAIENTIRQRDSRRAFELVEASKARSLLEFVRSGKSIAEVEKDFASVAYPLSLDEIRLRLPERVQVVQYAALPDRLAIWILSRSRFDLIDKRITSDELENRLETYQSSIVSKAPQAVIRQMGQELYDLLIPPGLAAEQHLCLVPDKSLHQLPFAALVSRDGRYLLEDFTLFYAPSASVFIVASENARSKEQITEERLLTVGNPNFDREENRQLRDLYDAEAEAKAVARIYGKSLELLGDNATKANFLRNFAKVEVVHFAGHFVANGRSPGNSKLLFAGGDLRSSELGAYRLPNAKLAVLSACRTGFERYNKSEGAIGIARTLLALGVPAVVASQWQVDSERTKDLMVAFHHNRKQKGLTTAESLRQAQIEMLGAEKTNAPFYWAAFSLFGGYVSY
jgi:CHAT domain-containing protein